MARTVAAPGRTNRRFLLIAILFAALSGSLMYAWMASQGGDEGGGSAGAGSQQVVVARQAIQERTAITAEMLEVKSVSTNAVVDGAFTDIDSVVGKVTKLPIAANAQVVQTAVIDTSRPTAEQLAQVVPTGKRAFSIDISEITAAGGLILPGDYVDIIWVCCTGGSDGAVALTRTLLQNVQVAAISQNLVVAGPVSGTAGEGEQPAAENPVAAAPGEAKPEAVSMTLLVTPEQSHLLAMAQPTGELHAALRGVGDTTVAAPDDDWTLAIELLPVEILAQLPEGLWPDGYRDEQ